MKRQFIYPFKKCLKLRYIAIKKEGRKRKKKNVLSNLTQQATYHLFKTARRNDTKRVIYQHLFISMSSISQILWHQIINRVDSHTTTGQWNSGKERYNRMNHTWVSEQTLLTTSVTSGLFKEWVYPVNHFLKRDKII